MIEGGTLNEDRGAVSLPVGEAHLWTMRTPLEPPALERCAECLCEEELARTHGAPVEEGNRYVSVRGALRILLGRYLGIAPASVQIDYGPYGKPHLSLSHGSDVRFSVTHAGELAMLAFVRGGEIGVDVERVRTVHRMERIAERILAPEAMVEWRSLREDVRGETFFREWTRLEARSKLSGEGVWRTLVRRAHLEAGPASTLDLAPAEGYRAALAMELPTMEVRRFLWVYQDGPEASSASNPSVVSGRAK